MLSCLPVTEARCSGRRISECPIFLSNAHVLANFWTGLDAGGDRRAGSCLDRPTPGADFADFFICPRKFLLDILVIRPVPDGLADFFNSVDLLVDNDFDGTSDGPVTLKPAVPYPGRRRVDDAGLAVGLKPAPGLSAQFVHLLLPDGVVANPFQDTRTQFKVEAAELGDGAADLAQGR